MKQFIIDHFDAIITILITILGFIITYFLNQSSFRDEVKKDKLSRTAEEIKSLPFDICQMMDAMIGGKFSVEQYSAILSKVLAYGSKDAVSLAVKMQQLSYKMKEAPMEERFIIMATYALLITQLKYDLTSEIISPESWFQLRLTDYNALQSQMKGYINDLVDELNLNRAFKV